MYRNDLVIHFCNSVIPNSHNRHTFNASHDVVQLPVIMHLATRGCREHMKLREMNPFSTQSAEVARCLVRLHLTITKKKTLHLLRISR